MFNLHSVLFGAFAHHQSQRIPFEGERTLVGGENGSGKTSLLDGIRLALGHERTYHKKGEAGYLTGTNRVHVVAVVAYNKHDKEHAFAKLGIKSEYVTLGRVWMPKGSARLESVYVIEAGNLDIPDIVAASKERGIAPTRYRDQLKLIGLTPAVIDHLIVKQGEVQNITDESPRNLHRLVMATNQVEETALDYERARQKQIQVGRELVAARDIRNDQLAQLNTLREQRKLYRQKLDYESRIIELAFEQRAYELQSAILAHREAEGAMRKHHSEKVAMERLIAAEQPQLDHTTRQLEALNLELASHEKEHNRTASARKKAEDAYFAAVQARNDLNEAKKRLSANRGLGNLETLEATQATAKQANDQAIYAHGLASTSLNQAEAGLEAARKGQPRLPPGTQATTAALTADGIEHDLLGTLVKADAKTQGRLEHALGNLRYTIIVKAADHKNVVKVASKHGHEGPVLVGKAEPPAWLESFKPTGDGVESPFGTWTATATQLVMGKGKDLIRLAEAALQAARSEEAAARQSLEAATSELALATDKLARGKQTIADQQLYAKEEQILADFESKQANWRSFNAAAARSPTELSASIQVLSKSLAELEGLLKQRRDQVTDNDRKFADASERFSKAQPIITQLESDLTPSWVEKARGAERLHEAGIRRERERIQRELQDIKAPGPEIEDMVTRLDSQVEKLNRNLEALTKQQEESLAKVEEARSLYAQFCNGVARAYCERVKAWAKRFDLRCRAVWDNIDDANQAEMADRAGIHASFGFDKEPTPMSASGFSGGQRVIMGMVLRLAMSEINENSFFIVDQPYDELDVHNTQILAEHLKNVPLHVIIVVPNSESPSHYHGIVRGIKMYRAIDTEWAPRPEVVGLAKAA